jgi:hypothetical protein
MGKETWKAGVGHSKGSVSLRHCDHATHTVERLHRIGAKELGGGVINEEGVTIKARWRH